MDIIGAGYRGALRDSIQYGHVAVVDFTGKLLAYIGDPYYVAYARSSAKPMQAMVPVETGAVDAYGLTERETALLCGSHSGAQIHTDAVRSILHKAGLDESCLQCGVHRPFDAEAAKKLDELHLQPTEVYNNCSGKHAGMLITAKYKGESLNDYYLPEHPHQQRILRVIADLCRYDAEKIIVGTDGCGVPVHAMPLYHFALGMARLGRPDCLDGVRGESAARLLRDMIAYPEMLSGPGKPECLMMTAAAGKMFIKSGADAYFAGAIPEQGIGFALKVECSRTPFHTMAVAELLRQLGGLPDTEEIRNMTEKKILNYRGELVGSYRAEITLRTV